MNWNVLWKKSRALSLFGGLSCTFGKGKVCVMFFVAPYFSGKGALAHAHTFSATVRAGSLALASLRARDPCPRNCRAVFYCQHTSQHQPVCEQFALVGSE